jgi:mono/diheme cytochrome c family protein
MHKVEVQFFQVGGGAELRVDVTGPGLPMQALAPLIFLTEQGNPKVVVEKNKEDEEFAVNPALVAKGREIFASHGCASCHQLSVGGKLVESKSPAATLAKMKTEGGCLSPMSHKGVPQFTLSNVQRESLTAALAKLQKGQTPLGPNTANKRDLLAWRMTTFNCYACHQRDKIGGADLELDASFVTTQPEMGDEGRLPPPLNGVGAKLNTPYFKHILANGAHDRPYMLTHMPGFGAANTDQFVDLFGSLDSVPEVKEIAFKETVGKVKAASRHLIGPTAFGCIKCHTFAGHKAEGVQGMDMTLMTARVRHDWFHFYLLNPQKYRPGTRMPSAFPGGETPLKKILDGDADKQIEGMWLYLADGKRAALPKGIGQQFIELVPENEAIIYRNFIADAGPRAIGVGFPEKAHLAFDANNMRLALIWQGSFIDASRHWTDRGAGYQPPLGDSVMKLPNGPTFAVLAKAADPWPTKSAKELGYKFHGYRLTPDNRPTFLYTYNGISIEDTPNAVDGPKQPFLRRTYSVTAPQASDNLWLRAAAGSKIEAAGKGWYLINGTWRMRIEAAAEPQIRQNGGNAELLVPVRFKDGRARIVQEYVW